MKKYIIGASNSSIDLRTDL